MVGPVVLAGKPFRILIHPLPSPFRHPLSMRYRIQHTTHYMYQRPVHLGHHVLRLRPRSDHAQQLQEFSIDISPNPARQTAVIELEGNDPLGVWFPPTATTDLTIKTIAKVETFCQNPFDYLAEPWAVSLPIDYPTSMASLLSPYLHHPLYPVVSPNVIELAQDIVYQVEGNVGFFLTTLTQRIYETCQYTVRPTGPPLPPGLTWAKKLGSCRDFTVLFMAACRAVGLAARFVSGYEEGDSNILERDLHAWAEVYIPGGGWRGFDPTHGLAVADHHVVLVASAFPGLAAPVSGSTQEGGSVSSGLTTQVRVNRLA
jgi:transglutaminase-like putative cysteine protease